MIKKKGFSISLLILIVSIPSLPSEKIEFFKKINIKLTSGMGYFNGGDINRVAEFWNLYFPFYKNYKGREGKVKELHYGGEMELETLFKISGSIEIGLGIGALKAESKINIKAYPGWFGAKGYTSGYFNPEIEAIPIKLNCYYLFPLSSRTSLFLKGGLGYYSTKMKFYRKIENTIEGYPEGLARNDEVNDEGIGFHGGVGIYYRLWKKIEIVIEGEGRVLKLNKLKGKEVYEYWEESRYRRYVYEGYLNYIETLIDYALWRDLWMHPLKLRNAELDLSGFSLRAGIRIRL